MIMFIDPGCDDDAGRNDGDNVVVDVDDADVVVAAGDDDGPVLHSLVCFYYFPG